MAQNKETSFTEDKGFNSDKPGSRRLGGSESDRVSTSSPSLGSDKGPQPGSEDSRAQSTTKSSGRD